MRDTRGTEFRSMIAKPVPPGLPQDVQWRARLADQLTSGVAVARPVTMVSAGPGWGKTVAAASWARSCSARHPVSWLSLDDADNNRTTFWSNLVTALVAGGTVPDRSPLREHRPGDPFADADLKDFCSQLTDLPSPLCWSSTTSRSSPMARCPISSDV